MRTKDFNEDEILNKAIAIFWQNGYHATSLPDLINGLGIGRSSIYHAFGDKHTLFAKALERYQLVATARFQKTLQNTSSVKKELRGFLTTVVNDVFSDTCPKGCFKVNTEVELTLHDELVRKMIVVDDLLIEDALHQAIVKGQDTGEISRSKNAKALARFICNNITGMRVYSKFRNDRQFFDDIVETTMLVFD